jgi:RNA polymerase-binding transcription factor DksA
MLSSDDLRRFKQRLQAERDAIEARLGDNQQSVKETVRNENGVGDVEDEAHVLYDREEALGEEARDSQELAQINKALARIEQGTYGVSEVSGKPIPKDRLEALPSATTLAGERAPN